MNSLMIETYFENELKADTMTFINSKTNWNVETQTYKDESAENCKANIADCKVYWRGEYLILEHNDIIHYWDSHPYCFLKDAIVYFEPQKPAKWKTLNKLIDLRMAIRQTEVNHCGFVDLFLLNETMTINLYNKFMGVSRAQDLEHHGSPTF